MILSFHHADAIFLAEPDSVIVYADTPPTAPSEVIEGIVLGGTFDPDISVGGLVDDVE